MMLAVMSTPVTVINIMMAVRWRGEEEEEAWDFVFGEHLC